MFPEMEGLSSSPKATLALLSSEVVENNYSEKANAFVKQLKK
jgi:hypothetical protein